MKKDINHYIKSNKYTFLQIEQIMLGLEENLDVTIYDKEYFNWAQMRQLRLGLLKHLNVSICAKKYFNWKQMSEIILGLEQDLEVSIYAKEYFNWEQMEQIRLGLYNKLNITIYAKPYFDWKQMKEIRIGLSQNLDVLLYAKECFNWKQMKQIRWRLTYNLNPNLDIPLSKTIKTGYKAFNTDLTCNDFQYKEDEIFTLDNNPEICNQGFHFCLNLDDCYDYYDKENCIIHKVEILGNIDIDSYGSKCCTDKIKICKRII